MKASFKNFKCVTLMTKYVPSACMYLFKTEPRDLSGVVLISKDGSCGVSGVRWEWFAIGCVCLAKDEKVA